MLKPNELRHLNSGECADIYEVDSSTVLKLGKVGWSRDLLYQEYLNGRIVSDCGIPAPGVYDFVEIDERYGYTMEKLKDLPLMDMMWKRPWMVVSYARAMAEIHAKIHSARADKGLPELTEKYRDFIGEKKSISDEVKRLLFLELDELSGKGDECICHGDFHPINILVDGKRYYVIDWVLATRGDPRADVAGTYLITRTYSSCMREQGRIKSFISAVGGRIISKIYLDRYISITGMERKEIMRWIPIRAATYLDVGLPEKLENAFHKIVDEHYGAMSKHS